MRTVGRILPVFAGLLIVLTYLLVRGATPDAALHERTLAALQALILNDAALHRDVLRARAGLLRNYDPLVQSVAGLRAAVNDLAAVRAIASDEASEEIGDRLAGLAAAVAEQEDLVERFKSDNALLQNSLSYFIHASHEFGRRAEDASAAQAVGALANGMLRFTSDPSAEAAAEVTVGLDHLASLPPAPTSATDTRALVAHGRLIVSAQPAVDGVVRRLLAAPVGPRARLLQDLYLDSHGRAVARAGIYRVLLYAAAVVLAGYLGYLFLRLRANARSLEARLHLESLIAEISTRFINLPRDRLGEGMSQGLAALAGHAAVDRAYILLRGSDGVGPVSDYRWQRGGLPAADAASDRDLLEMAFGWSPAGYERQACIHVPGVTELPAGAEKAVLSRRGIRSWLCIPLWRAGRRVGLLGLDAVRDAKSWPDDDIALLRTAGEIFLNALERARTDSERDALEVRLRQAQRIEAIGTLAGGIAHNFNNILGAILGYSEMALGRLPKDSGAWRQIQEVRKAGRRAKDLVDQILTFGRHGGHGHVPVQMPALVTEAVSLLRVSLPATVEIGTWIQTDAAVVPGDAAQLQQVIMNLCTNAAQAMDGRGTVDIALNVIELDAPRMLSHGNLAAGCYVRLAVADSGHGMDARTLERIFEPFFTTKPPGVGTGLGLASVHGIVADHGGALNVRSRPGAGSTFEVYLAATDAAGLVEERPQAPAPIGRGETVLLVDDDRPLMLLGEEMLAALGYEPAGFDSSPQALAAFRADPARFDLVLADQVMPEMTGSELAAAMHALRPDLPIILVTGYGTPVATDGLRAAGVREVLRKPLSSAELAGTLARHLGPGARPAAPSPPARLSHVR